MWPRPFWTSRLEQAWARRSVLWLMGVRRAGKTVLVRSLPDVEYLDCELPRVRALLLDPESFLSERIDRTIALDEVHRLPNPSEILKIRPIISREYGSSRPDHPRSRRRRDSATRWPAARRRSG
jgi:hypothetical protein